MIWRYHHLRKHPYTILINWCKSCSFNSIGMGGWPFPMFFLTATLLDNNTAARNHVAAHGSWTRITQNVTNLEEMGALYKSITLVHRYHLRCHHYHHNHHCPYHPPHHHLTVLFWAVNNHQINLIIIMIIIILMILVAVGHSLSTILMISYYTPKIINYHYIMICVSIHCLIINRFVWFRQPVVE